MAQPTERHDPVAGRWIVRSAVWTTALFTAASLIGVAWPEPFMGVAAVIDLVLFALGCAAFTWAYARAVARSRYEVLSLEGLFFLGHGAAPATTARTLRVALAVQVLVAIVAAAVRPFTESAFGVLVPTLGLGLMALWGARHGRFEPRAPG